MPNELDASAYLHLSPQTRVEIVYDTVMAKTFADLANFITTKHRLVRELGHKAALPFSSPPRLLLRLGCYNN
jgi:hypothetical protein